MVHLLYTWSPLEGVVSKLSWMGSICLIQITSKNSYTCMACFVVGKGPCNQHVYLRRLERVFCCCSVCETMEDYKEGYLIVWTNYMSPCSSIVGLYFKGTCDIISVTIAMHKVHKVSSKFQFP